MITAIFVLSFETGIYIYYTYIYMFFFVPTI